MIRYVTLGTKKCDEAAGCGFRDLGGNRLNAFCMHEAGS